MPPGEPSAVRPPARKILGLPALPNDNSPPLLIVLSTAYPWYSLNTALQSTAPYKITKRAKTKYRYNNFTSLSPLLNACILSVACVLIEHCRVSVATYTLALWSKPTHSLQLCKCSRSYIDCVTVYVPPPRPFNALTCACLQ